jgi:hypothetical protein
MKWVIYSVCGFAVVDLIILQYNINTNVDVFTPGIYVVLLLFLILYTVLCVLIIDKRELMDKYPFRSLFILMPCFLYLLIHIMLSFWWINNWLRFLFSN